MTQNEINELQERPQDERSRLVQLRNLLVDPLALKLSPEERRVARLAASFLFILVMFEFIGGLARFVVLNLSFIDAFSGALGLTLFSTAAAYGLARIIHYRVAVFFFSLAYGAVAYISILSQGRGADAALFILIYVVPGLIVTSSFLGPRAVLLLTGLNLAVFFTATSMSATFSGESFAQAAMIAMIGLLLFVFTNFRRNYDKSRLEQVQTVNRKLEDITTNLEQRVEERTRQLEIANRQATQRAAQLQAVTDLSETIAQVKNLTDIFPEAARLISEYFDFYHVGIFLIDGAREFAILQAANSEGGKRMLARSHRLRLGTGVVGYSAQTGLPRIALDVGSDAVFFNNPDLAETRSEAAMPMNSRGETIGVLDVQSTEVQAFSSEDLQILTTLANQVAIAIDNARLLTETRAALVQVQEVYNEFTRAEWGRTVSKAEQPGFRYHAGRIEMLEKELNQPEVTAAVGRGKVVTGSTNGTGEQRSTVAVPVKLRGEIIGVIHVESNDPARPWREDEVSLVEAVAERAAVAMENARLFQEARRRAVKEQAISEATARISSAFNLENILQATAEELERVLGGSEVLIRFKDREKPQ
jgi:GAF domain-containing protein